MQFSLYLLFLACLNVSLGALYDEFADDAKEWSLFLQKFGKHYDSVTSDYHLRLKIFQKNLQKIREHNQLYYQNLTTYKMGINFFADQTAEEFLRYLNYNNTLRTPNLKKHLILDPVVKQNLPGQVDWREFGAVTAIENQGQCGGCWSFSSVGALESHYFLKTGNLIELSKQQLIDCDTSNMGCHGGYIEEAFNYLIANGAQAKAEYPYVGYNYYCRYDPSRIFATMSNYVKIPAGNEDYLQYAVGTVGPVSVALDASNFAFYQSGIYDDAYCNPYSLNHAVLVVGYGSDNRYDYWTVKNSWGWDYGEQGYIRIMRNRNQCGIANDASYPII